MRLARRIALQALVALLACAGAEAQEDVLQSLNEAQQRQRRRMHKQELLRERHEAVSRRRASQVSAAAQEAMQEGGAKLQNIRYKLLASAYRGPGGVDIQLAFKRSDKDSDGTLRLDELKVRRQ